MALKFIRDNLKSLKWFLVVVLAALVWLIFADWGGYSQSGAGARTDVAATVGGETISFGELQDAYRNLESQYREAFGEQFNDELARQLNLKMQALNQLINQRILLREARRIGLRVTDEEVREQILEYPVFQRDGRFVGQEEYRQHLRRFRTTPAEFERQQRQFMLLEKLGSVLAASVYVSDAEVEEAYREEVERAKIRYVELPAAEIGDVEVAESELETYLEEHAAQFEIPARRVVDYLLVDTGKLRQEVEIAEDAMRAYYDANQAQYTRPERVTARHILRRVTPERPEEVASQEIEDLRRRIESGEDFAQLAQESSDDTVSARAGGTLRPFGRGEMVPEFEEAAFSAQDGELVGPVRSAHGFHLIEKLSYAPGGVQSFEEVQPAISARLLAEEAGRLAESKAFEIAGRVTPEMSAEDFRALAAAEGLEAVTTEPFGEDDALPGLGRNPAFNQAAFELAVGEVSQPISVARGQAILKVREIQEPRLPELAEVEDQVRQTVVDEKRKEAARARLAEAAAAGKSVDEVAGELGLEVQEPAEFGRRGTIAGLGRSRAVVDAALALETGEVGGPLATDRGAVLFAVAERKSFDPAAFAEARETKRETLKEQRVRELQQAILAERRQELNPQYGAGVIESFGQGEQPSSQG
ncbi:MAG TPA: SurA N-terminal domain-containing protein [Thermoanaerobaculia bacterium]